MKKLSRKHQKTKRGAASLYVVIFTTLLFGVITLSFVRLLISEATKTTNTDLSQSAYDSAMAGVEDAKIALIKYHDCLSQGYVGEEGSLVECSKAIWEMQNGIKQDSCDSVAKSLSRTQESDGSVIIQETKRATDAGNSADLMQAYTCVKVAEELPDYRTTLNSDIRLRVIPLRAQNIDELAGIGVKWYSDQNKASAFNWSGISKVSAGVPPVISVQILQADEWFRLSQLSASSSIGTDRGTVFLSPHKTGTDLPIADNDNRKVNLGFNNLVTANTLRLTSDKTPNQLYNVTCADVNSNAAPEWYCNTYIEIPRTYAGTNRNDGATFAIVTLPYGSPATDISLQMFKSNGEVIEFSGVQARVDSTGRANDLYRRLETRIELVDLNYPYPEFAIEMRDDDDNIIKKNFAVTRNCWSSGDGDYSACPNNQDLSY